jgi:hypothetical protein
MHQMRISINYDSSVMPRQEKLEIRNIDKTVKSRAPPPSTECYEMKPILSMDRAVYEEDTLLFLMNLYIIFSFFTVHNFKQVAK